MEHKYIRHEVHGFIVWPKFNEDSIWHSAMGRFLKERREEGKIISAGFVIFKDGMPICFGDSESLHKESLPEDSEKLAEQFGL